MMFCRGRIEGVAAAFLRDPRHFQVLSLGLLVAWGFLRLDFDVSALEAAAAIGTCIAIQACGSRWAALAFDLRSPLISAFSLILILRTDSPALMAFAAGVAIASKFLLRHRGRHIFNPTALGIALTVLLFDGAWISHGQWGSAPVLALCAAGLGTLVIWRSERSDVTVAFLLAFPGMLLVRALWLGDPLAIWMHQLTSGALVLFAFFMVSDPKTTPDTRTGRCIFAVCVAALAMGLRFGLWDPNALIYALVICATTLPIINTFTQGPKYFWPNAQGEKHATNSHHSLSPLLRSHRRPNGLRILRVLRREGRHEVI